MQKKLMLKVPSSSEMDECAICLTEDSQDRSVLTCGHSFCRSCIEQWLQKAAVCPMCSSFAYSATNIGANVVFLHPHRHENGFRMRGSTVTYVKPRSAAESAGLMIGDRVRSPTGNASDKAAAAMASNRFIRMEILPRRVFTVARNVTMIFLLCEANRSIRIIHTDDVSLSVGMIICAIDQRAGETLWTHMQTMAYFHCCNCFALTKLTLASPSTMLVAEIEPVCCTMTCLS